MFTVLEISVQKQCCFSYPSLFHNFGHWNTYFYNDKDKVLFTKGRERSVDLQSVVLITLNEEVPVYGAPETEGYRGLGECVNFRVIVRSTSDFYKLLRK